MSEIKHCSCYEYLNTLADDSIDLILTDPPYITSRKTGMDEHSKVIKKLEDANLDAKTPADWEKWSNSETNAPKEFTVQQKNNYLKYGSVYGKKYAVVTDYGKWDSEFTMDELDQYIKTYYTKLRKGGTCIIFFDLWKISELKIMMESSGFKQIRFIEWVKTNPQPLNSSVNYLTNCREIALLGIKGSNPTFNGKYDNGIYTFPLQGGKERFHPTQKSVKLFEALIEKHSKEDDVVLDTFMGSGTTAVACKSTKRIYKGCEADNTYYEKLITRLQ